MGVNSIEKLKEQKEEMLKKLQARILKEQNRLKKKAKEELHNHIEYAITGLELNELRELENISLIYGIFENYSKLSDDEKKALLISSKELDEKFRLSRKRKYDNGIRKGTKSSKNIKSNEVTNDEEKESIPN